MPPIMQLPRLDAQEHGHPQTPKQFADVFGSSAADVTAWFNWQRLRSQAEHYTVQQEYLKQREEIGQLSTLWYRTPEGTRGWWLEQESRRTTIQESTSLPHFPTDQDTHEVDVFINAVAQEGAHPQLTVPAFRTQAGETIILDGTHRTAAIYRAGIPVTIRLLTVTGKDDPYVMPDMVTEHYKHESAENWLAQIQPVRAFFHTLYGLTN